jgi:hypothetical protein
MLNAAMKAHLQTTFTAQELEECGDNANSPKAGWSLCDQGSRH